MRFLLLEKRNKELQGSMPSQESSDSGVIKSVSFEVR